MGKRFAPEAEGKPESPGRHVKRQKVEGASKGGSNSPLKTETIESARQLQNLLIFQQGAVPQLRNGIQSFKLFLESILYPTEDTNVGRQRAILRDYLDTQKPKDETDKDAVFLPSLFQSLSFANDTTNDYLYSAVVAVLALLLKTLSNHLESRDYGLSLGRTILQTPHMKLISRGLSAPKHKEHVISPCLRLLTEVVSFDGGSLARQVYSKRDFTFDVKIMARNLNIRNNSAEEGVEVHRKPSVRSNAVRYLLAHLKFQHEGAKVDILKQGMVLRALFDHIRDDTPQLATDILETVKTHVVLDTEVLRSSKSYLLTDRTLASIASLYKAERLEETADEKHKPVDAVAHEFLLLVCTTPGLGVMIPSSGWYPPGTEREADGELVDGPQEDIIDLGLDTVEWYGKFQGNVPVRNTTLASFTQGMRPYANILEQQLLVAIFKASPELVADYFFKKATFSFDPKLTATWIGYSAFLFSTVQLPAPQYLGPKNAFHDIPPPISIVIENILPQPLTQKVLTRCLNQSLDLITFFAVRILTVAFQKLQSVLETFKEASSGHGSLWEQASRKLVMEFCQRCPRMKDVISVFRNTPANKHMQREAVTRLLMMYYEAVPEVALDEKFDVAVPLTTALASLDNLAEDENKEFRLLELSHLLQIARHSPNMNWWQKPKTLRFSPFTTLLKLITTPELASTSYTTVRQLLHAVVRESGFLQFATNPLAIEALVASLGKEKNWTPSDDVYNFLDDCFNRFVRKPIKYQDDLDAIAAKTETDLAKEPVSPLLMTLLEQWPHVEKSDAKDTAKMVTAQWLARFVYYLKSAGENETILSQICKDVADVSSKANAKLLKNALKPKAENVPATTLESKTKEKKSTTETQPDIQGTTSTELDSVDLCLPPSENERHPGLQRWAQKEVEEAIEEGHAGELILCLCSKELSIRKQALANIRKLVANIENSTYTEWEQVDLLLGELIETARPIIDDKPLPYVAGVFATRALSVLADPTHFMYPKVNKFLNKGPNWSVGRLPSYWAEKILLNPPEEDDAWHKEVGWLLDYLFDALRTGEDMEIFRARSVFERLLALYISPFASEKLRVKILRLLFRAAAVGGSTTLITRSGVISWIQVQLTKKDKHERLLKRLATRLYAETCDKERVDEWSAGGITKAVEAIVGKDAAA